MAEQQLSLWDLLEQADSLEAAEPIYLKDEDGLTVDDIPGFFTDENLVDLHEGFLIENVRAAFGLSRGGNKRKPSEAAWEWILSEDKKVPLSFDVCCREFNADPETVLELLMYYKKKLL